MWLLQKPDPSQDLYRKPNPLKLRHELRGEVKRLWSFGKTSFGGSGR